MKFQIEDYIISFLSRKETPSDVRKLKEWLAFDPERRNELKQWLALWDICGMVDITEKCCPDRAYQRFMFQIQ